MDEAIDMQLNRRGGIHPPPARPLSTSKENPPAISNPKQALRLDTTTASTSLRAPSTTSTAKTSHYFTAHSSGSAPIPDIGLSPRPALSPDPELDFDITWDVDDPAPSKLPVQKSGSMSARPLPTAPAKHVPLEKKPSSPDPYDDLSFDMDVDDSFLEQVGMIEQGALSTDDNSKGKGKGKVSRTDGRPSVAPARKTPSGSVLGTKPLAICPVSTSGAESSTRMQSSAKRATSTSSMSRSTESCMPKSTQSSGRRLPRDPSLIVISSSEDEAPGSHGTAKPLNLARRRANKRMGMDRDMATDSDVIDLTD